MMQTYFWATYYFFYQIKAEHYQAYGLALGFTVFTLSFLAATMLVVTLIYLQNEVLNDLVLSFFDEGGALIGYLAITSGVILYQYKLVNMEEQKAEYGTTKWLKDYAWLIFILPPALSLLAFVVAMFSAVV